MTYLATFHWGWLLAALLLGFCMGWIAVVHRGRGVSKVMTRWLAGLAVILVAVALATVRSRRSPFWWWSAQASPWSGPAPSSAATTRSLES